MALDPMMINPVLDIYKKMIAECEEKQISGENFDKMCEVYDRIEQLGKELSDFNEFNAIVMRENLYGMFGDYYGRALMDVAKSNETDGYDDAQLLKNNLEALKDAIKTIKEEYKNALSRAENEGDRREVEVLHNPDSIIKPIEDLIALGEEEGMTYPDFLRIQIERGLDKAAEGTVATKSGLQFIKGSVECNPSSPYELRIWEEKYKSFEAISAKSKFGVPNLMELSMADDDIERKYYFQDEQFRKITKIWEGLLSSLSLWSLAHASFAPYIDPWKRFDNPPEQVRYEINVTPGFFVQELAQLEEIFGIGFYDIFTHETFLWSVKYNYIEYSCEFVKFLARKVFPHCKPFQKLPEELIHERKEFSIHGPNKEDREENPLISLPAERIRDWYDSVYGEGTYDGKFTAKYGPIPKSKSVAEPWSENFTI
jgi:hypothetical protein